MVQVIHHEVKELGTHILVCEVTYNSAHTDKMNFRKFFKFQVLLISGFFKFMKNVFDVF